MRRFLYFLPLLLTISCSSFKPRPVPNYHINKIDIHPGFVKKVQFQVPEDEDFKFQCNGKDYGYDVKDGFLRSYVSADYNFKKDSFICSLLFKRGEKYISRKVLQMNITPYAYPFRKLKVNKKHVELSPENLKRYLREVKTLKAVYSKINLNTPYFIKPFVRPLNSKVTSIFGTKRIFNNKKETWHSGIDFRARTPIPIPVSNKGKVIFTGHLFFNGNTVIVDHGLGITTMYCHLSKILVGEGDVVLQKDIIGKSGNTGRSNAPHLHWGVKVQNISINGFSLLEEGI
jgi:murein DD-endopeptidase MepM/ murein hydrolase activator NlpD